MLKPRFAVSMIPIGLMVLGANGVSGQDYPNKVIRFVTAGTGGGADFTSRLIAPAISGPLGQPVVVDNRPGIVAIETVAKAPPDGYTVLVTGGTLWIGPLLQKAPYDPVRDFSPITLVVSTPNIIAAHPSMPVKSVKELIALAKAKPGVLNYASGSIGGSGHLGAELFKAMAGVNIVRIAYKGTALAYADAISGQVHMLFENPAVIMPLARAGKLRAIAVTSTRPSALVPGLPTVAEILPGYEVLTPNVMLAPAKTVEAIINRLNREIVRVVNMADVKEKFLENGQEVVGNSPQEFAAFIKSDMAKWGKVIKDAGIKIE